MNLECIERSLEALPRERESIQKKIVGFEEDIESGKQRIKEMEDLRKEILIAASGSFSPIFVELLLNLAVID